jgi:prephenate dehydratase
LLCEGFGQRLREEMGGMRVGYQGEPGAFSEDAARLLFPEENGIPCRTFRAIFEGIAAASLDHGVVPLENSQAGSINETFDLLAAGGATIVGEVVVRVDHALLALPGTFLQDVRRVSSHPQALAQCQEFLAALDAEVVPDYDTAGAAKRIADERLAGEAAVAAERAADVYGLAVLARRIQTWPENWTRFAAIASVSSGRPPLGPPDKTSLVFGTPDVPGALLMALRPFADRGLNLSKLESRPIPARPWEYRFYLDIEAGLGDAGLQMALAELEGNASFVTVLGSYPRWPEGSG